MLIVGAQLAPDEDGEGGYKPFHAEYDTGQAAAHLTLQARAMGLHAHQFAGFDKAAVADELGVPAYYKLMAGIAVGVPGDPDGRARAGPGPRAPGPPPPAAREGGPRRRAGASRGRGWTGEGA